MTEGNGAANALDDLQEISSLLNTGLDRQTLSAAIQCIELGKRRTVAYFEILIYRSYDVDTHFLKPRSIFSGPFWIIIN